MSELLSTAEFDESPALGREGAATALVAPTDGERLMRFVRFQDESAFAQVVETHAAMVWGVCSQILRHHQDVEDAFQATFLILARKARSIRAADSAGGWLCRVAYRTALLAHGRRSRRNETTLTDEPASFEDQLAEIERNEQSVRLLEELNALPALYREAIVLCYLEGRTRVAAAEQMGLSSQAVKGLLARGTRQLRTRLVRRGIALSTSIAVVNSALSSAQGAVTPSLVASTVAQGATFAVKLPLAASGLKGAATSGAAYTLAEKGIIAMAISAASKPAVGIMGVCLAVGMLTVAEARPKLPTGRGVMDVVFVAAADGEGEAAVEASPAAQDLMADDQPAETREEPSSPLEIPNDGQAAFPQLEPLQEPIADPAPTQNPAFAYGSTSAKSVEGAPAGEVQTWQFQSVPAARQVAPLPGAAPALVTYAQASALNPMAATPPIAGPPGLSVATLKLEQEYWELKAQGLKTKAEALALKARAVQEAGRGSQAEIFELAAEQELTLAEVKLCEMNSQRIKDSLPATKVDATMKAGSVGDDVKALQQALNWLRGKGSSALVVDGHFGALTEQLVRQIQRAHGITPNGIVGPETIAVLNLHGVLPAAPVAAASSGWNPPTPTSNAFPQIQPTVKELKADVVKVRQGEMSIVPKEKLDELAELAKKNAELQKQIKELEREKKSPIK